MIKRIDNLIEKIYYKSSQWVRENEEEYYFIDPLDNEEILAHYGTSHFGVASTLLGIMNNDQGKYEQGINLIKSYLNRWERAKQSLNFHSDFNNFSLCVLLDELEKAGIENELQQNIQKVIINSEDSNHNTINWLPMRIYVNYKRFQWTKLKKYKEKCLFLEKQILNGMFNDGYIDDRLPIGLSYNLQYNVATVSVMHFLSIRKAMRVNVSENLGALLDAAQIDGDINYFGRGTNQIFAWGLWIYLLSSSGLINELDKALIFFESRIENALENNNILLNEYNGNNKYMWWDYHYCSVYTAHLLFWLVLAKLDYQRGLVVPKLSPLFRAHDSGVMSYANKFFKITTFSGRKEYLSEKGPMVTSLSIKRVGVVYKGCFGPWSSENFGEMYSFDNLTVYNVLGLISSESFPSKKGRFRKKIFGNRFLNKVGLKLSPLFCDIEVKFIEERLELTFINNNRNKAFLNFPVFQELFDCFDIDLFIDEKKQNLYDVGIIKNQYGLCKLIQSRVNDGFKWKICLRDKN